MPMDRSCYPADWQAIADRIRAREHHRCKWCGIAAGTRVIGRSGRAYRIVLTVAHLDHDTTHNDPDNLAALCQSCHLGHDVDQHRRNAAATRRRRQVAAGQLTLMASELQGEEGA